MIRQYEQRGAALVMVEYINDDDPERGQPVDPEQWKKSQEEKKSDPEIKQPENK